MIKWNANFQIEDSTVQVAVAYVIIESFVNRSTNCKVVIVIKDEQENEIKRYFKIIEGIYNDEEEIYPILLNDFENAEIV